MLVTGAKAPARPAPVMDPSPLIGLIAECEHEHEHERLEFEETLRSSIAAATRNKKLEDVAAKMLAGITSRADGTLLIGVADAGTIRGLDRDHGCLGMPRDPYTYRFSRA